MSKNTILILVAAAGAVLYLQGKKTHAASIVAPTTPTKNVNGDMWARLLGDGWRNLVGGDGQTPNFLMKNIFGQVTTSDGVPILSGDPVNDYLQTGLGFPEVESSFVVGDLFGGSNPTGDPMNGFLNPNAYW